MKASVLQENLKAAVAVAIHAIAKRDTLPVLKNLKIEAKGTEVIVEATNLAYGIRVRIDAEVEEEGATTAPARLLKQVIEAQPAGRLALSLTQMSRMESLHVKGENSSATLCGQEAKDFPILAVPDCEATEGWSLVEVMPAELQRLVREVSFAASTDDCRLTFCTVATTLQDGQLQMVATDGYRLAIAVGCAQGPDIATAWLLDTPIIELIAKLSKRGNSKNPVKMLIPTKSSKAFFYIDCAEANGGRVKTIEMLATLVDARFPDYTAIIPKSSITTTRIPVQPMLRALKMVAPFAKGNAGIVTLMLEPGMPGRVNVLADSADIGQCIDGFAATVEGEALSIAFNEFYLTQYLKQVSKPAVVFRTTRETRPGMFTPVEEVASGAMHVVMPMHPPR